MTLILQKMLILKQCWSLRDCLNIHLVLICCITRKKVKKGRKVPLKKLKNGEPKTASLDLKKDSFQSTLCDS
ncbi:hypothetical protein ABW11_01145 [Pluralibacter gergoviae]|nr:hypothetical protein ABW08_00835 [Pluralibacter gergoviae]KMK30180.1 hypothetical protein ABW11_01145 [Pluralibacter gergoviae]